MAVESTYAANVLSFMSTPAMKKGLSVSAEKPEAADSSRPAGQRDSVSISPEALSLYNENKTKNPYAVKEQTHEQEEEARVKVLKERIQELQVEIRELEESDLPQKEKQKKIQEKQAELMVMLEELDRMQGGAEYFGGTRAEGAGSSAHNF